MTLHIHKDIREAKRIRQLSASTAPNASAIAGASYRFVEEVMRDLKRIAEDLQATDQLLRVTRRQTAAMLFRVDEADIKQSPELLKPGNIKVSTQDMKALRQNYEVTHRLYDTLQSLDTMAAKLKGVFAPDSKESQRAQSEVERVRKSVLKQLDEAFTMIQSLAQSKAPKEFTELCTSVNRIIEKSLAYDDSTSYIYLYEVDGILCFSHYAHLKNCTDESGEMFPNLYIVTSMKVSQPPQFFINTMKDFEPPSKAQLVKKVDDLKSIVRSLSILLDLDGFENAMGRLPLPLLVKPSDVRPQLFSYEQYIGAVVVDEDTGNLEFRLKATVTDKALVNKIATQLHVDTRGLIRKTQGKPRLRMTIKKVLRSYTITLYLQKMDDAPAAVPEDLEFLQTRFHLTEGQIEQVLRVVNS